MAAMQIARHLGAEVLSPLTRPSGTCFERPDAIKRALASSRDLGFKAQFLDLTGGNGVDVVLNS